MKFSLVEFIVKVGRVLVDLYSFVHRCPILGCIDGTGA